MPRSWISAKLEQHMNDMKKEFSREHNKLLGISNQNMKVVNESFSELDLHAPTAR